MREDMPGEMDVVGLVRQCEIAVEFHALQQRAVAAVAPAIEGPDRELARADSQRDRESRRAIRRNENRRRNVQLDRAACRIIGIAKLWRDCVSAWLAGIIPDRNAFSKRAVSR